jgi:hypothetical protein
MRNPPSWSDVIFERSDAVARQLGFVRSGNNAYCQSTAMPSSRSSAQLMTVSTSTHGFLAPSQQALPPLWQQQQQQ